MTTPEYTIRIVSHSYDRPARKELIDLLRAGKWGFDDKRQGNISTQPEIATTHLLYGSIIVIIIDCDLEVIDGKLTKDDILYVDLSSATSYNERVDIETERKMIRAELLGHTGAVWVLSPQTSGNAFYFPRNCPLKTMIDIRALGRSGIRLSKLLLDEMMHFKSPRVIGSGRRCGQTDSLRFPSQPEIQECPATIIDIQPEIKQQPSADIPWPLPEMVIALPAYVKVESVRHDPKTNSIIIHFG